MSDVVVVHPQSPAAKRTSVHSIEDATETESTLTAADTTVDRAADNLGVQDFINSIVDDQDDPTMPSLTPRVWVIGTVFTFLFAFANTVLTFRTNTFNIPAVVAILLILPTGRFLARVVPAGRWNPGPFSIKEHVLCGVMIGSAFIPLGVFNFISQKYILKQADLSVISGVGFVLGTQMIGYGLAGHCRKFLVDPVTMFWPTALTQVALYKTLNKVTMPGSILPTRAYSTGAFFWIALTGAAVYQWFPSFIAPLLSTLSILCVSTSPAVRLWGSGLPSKGMGLLTINLDWSLIARWTPLESPWWTKVNQFFGIYLILYVVLPILYYKNAFGMDQSLADPRASPYGVLNTLSLFNKTGAPLRPQMLISPTGNLLDPVYEANKPIYISTYYALTIALALFGYAATLSHTALWYGKSIKERLFSGINEARKDNPHKKIMSAYPDVPNWWFVVLLVVAIPLVMVTCAVGGFALSWWGVVIAIALAIVSMLPVGVLQALSGQQLPLQTISLFLSGIIFQGQTFAVLSFNTIAYMGMAQGLVLVQDLKIAYYMKIPPRHMFIVQLYGKILSAILMTLTAVLVMENWQTSLLTSPQWQYLAYRFFSSNAIIWGSVGTLRFFGSGTPYSGILWSLLAGAVAPVLPWLAWRKWKGTWAFVNVPLMAMIAETPGGWTTTVMPLVISFLSQFWMKRYHYALWARYNYVLAAALSAGTALTVLLIALTFGLRNVKMPEYFLNPTDGC
ncbi:hypothetical protein HDU88_006317 [Geranomyces variabilis]|nr:hypothetical protein HDU88_006317 [Geranomyces variabilis]